MEVAFAEAFGGLREVDGGSLEDSRGFRVTDGVAGDAVEATVGADEFLSVGDFLGVASRLGGFVLRQAVLVVESECEAVGIVRESRHLTDEPRARLILNLAGDELAHPVVTEFLTEPSERRNRRVVHRLAFDVLFRWEGIAKFLRFAVDLGPGA